MIRKPNITAILIFLLVPALSLADWEKRDKGRCDTSDGWQRQPPRQQCSTPPGEWCGKRRGDCYGERRPVGSAAEAKKIIEQQFSEQGLAVSTPVERKWGYEAELVDSSGNVVDRVLIHRKNGRIRSIY